MVSENNIFFKLVIVVSILVILHYNLAHAALNNQKEKESTIFKNTLHHKIRRAIVRYGDEDRYFKVEKPTRHEFVRQGWWNIHDRNQWHPNSRGEENDVTR